MTSRSSTPDPEIIIVVDSDNEMEEEISRRTKKSQHAPQRQQQGLVSMEQRFSQNPPNVLQELLGIVQWVNTGVKRDKSCEKTFMEKKVEELEKTVNEQEQHLELANKNISELKMSRADLQKEIEELQHTLAVERKERSALDRKWMQMKETFKTLQSTYFEDVPALKSNDIEKHRKLELANLKQEPDIPDPDAPAQQPNNQDFPISTMNQDEALFYEGPEVDQDDSNDTMIARMVEVQLGPVSGIQFQHEHEKPSTSKTNGPKNNSKMTEVSHAFDKSRQNLGVFCVCGMQFSTKRTLDSHIIYFTCEKRFICNLCDKRFVGTNYLKGHMLRSHKVSYTGGLNGCRDCGKTFSSLLQLRRHKKLVHYASYPVRKVGITKKDPGTSSTKRRRSIRMKRRHQKGELHSALTMLQGNCNNCEFCREAEKRKPRAQAVPQFNVNSNMVGAVGGNGKTNAQSQPQKLQSLLTATSALLPSITRSRHRSSSVSSDSAFFSCDYCNKWFGDDKCGLIKHQQSCQARVSLKNI